MIVICEYKYILECISLRKFQFNYKNIVIKSN